MAAPAIVSTILAYNQAGSGGNVYAYTAYDSLTPKPALTWCDLYDPAGDSHNLGDLPPGNLALEPGFLTYADATGAGCTAGSSLDCLPVGAHLGATSPLIDGGDPASSDADGSRADMGAYGGSGGDGWDLDGDGFYGSTTGSGRGRSTMRRQVSIPRTLTATTSTRQRCVVKTRP